MISSKQLSYSRPSRNKGFLGSLIFIGIASAAAVGIPLALATLSIVINSNNNRQTANVLMDPDATQAELSSISDQDVRNLRNDLRDNFTFATLGASLATAAIPGTGAQQVEGNALLATEAIVNQIPTLASEATNYFSDPDSSWNRNNGADRPNEGTVPTAGLLPGEVSGGTGDVRISLIWDANADLDLHVIDPCGFETDWTRKERICLGLSSKLDVDNISGGPNSVENIFWKTNEAPNGTYMYWVHCFNKCNDSPATFTLTRTVDGRRTSTTGTLRVDKEESEIITFTR